MQIAICAIFKNEGPYLQEWIAFHHLIGFNRFILYDNGSTDDGVEQLKSFALKDLVTVYDWPERPGQLTAYAHFFSKYKDEVDWVAFIDIDEFIHPLEEDTIFPLLERVGAHPAVLLNWKNFGPGLHIQRPDGLVIENYTLRLPDHWTVHKHVKTLGKIKGIKASGGCHIAPLRGNPCNARGETIKNEALTEVICGGPVIINHYYTKSREDWLWKVQRGRASVPDGEGPQRRVDGFDDFKRQARIEDKAILRFAPGVRRIMGL